MNLTYTQDKLVHKWGNMLIKDEMGEFGLLLEVWDMTGICHHQEAPLGGRRSCIYLNQTKGILINWVSACTFQLFCLNISKKM